MTKARDNEKVTRNGEETDILRKILMTNQMTREGGDTKEKDESRKIVMILNLKYLWYIEEGTGLELM